MARSKRYRNDVVRELVGLREQLNDPSVHERSMAITGIRRVRQSCVKQGSQAFWREVDEAANREPKTEAA